MGYTTKKLGRCDGLCAKGIKKLWFAVQDIHPGELISANAEKAFMQMRRQPNRLCQGCTGYVCGEGNIKYFMLIRQTTCRLLVKPFDWDKSEGRSVVGGKRLCLIILNII